MHEAKAQLRRVLRQQPAAGDNGAVCQRILEHPWFRQARTVMAYAAISPEPELMPVLEVCLAAGKILLLPRCQENGVMTARRVHALAELASGAYGILEPCGDAAFFPPENIELILVPGLAFARNGARLGRGKGYYDRFLGKTLARTIGVCYDSRCMDEIPVEDCDRYVDAVITDQKMILCEMEGDACLGKSAI